jgi:hypothetical protein
MVGRVCDHDVVSTPEGGDANLKCAFVALAFPVAPRDLNAAVAGLNAAGISAGYDPMVAGSIGLFDNNWNAMKFAMHTSPGNWETYIDSDPPFKLEPGRGYVFVEPVKSSVTWVQKP